MSKPEINWDAYTETDAKSVANKFADSMENRRAKDIEYYTARIKKSNLPADVKLMELDKLKVKGSSYDPWMLNSASDAATPETATSLVKPEANAQVAAARRVATPAVSKRGYPIVTKTVIVTKGPAAGKTRQIYYENVDGKLKRISLLQATTGKKPRAKNAAPKRKIAKKGGKSQYMKAKAKFVRAENKHARRVDKSKTANTVVYSAKKYDPQTNDFGGLDTERK